FERNRILYVGKGFEGKVDRVIDAKGKLVSPGFIDTHVHSGHRASHRLITDTGRPMYYGQPFLEISVPKEGKVVKGDPRYLKHGDAGSAAAFELNAAYTVIEFYEVVKEHMKTPIELLDHLGMLRPTLNIGHGNFISDNPNLNYSAHRDLELMGGAGVSVSHCPINIVRRARTLDDWQ